MSRSEFSDGNQLTLLQSGSAFFPALLSAIENARHEIRLETYIFSDDETGRRVADALCRAARRGIQTHVVVDGFGSAGFMLGLGAAMRRDGVEVLVYRPELARLRLRRQRLRRLHRKLVCIDAQIAFVGGINIVDDLDENGQARLDFAVRIEGPLLAALQDSMVHLWEIVRWANLGYRYRATPQRRHGVNRPGEIAAAFIVRDNLRHRRDIANAYLEAIHNAQHDILIANAYFLPGRRIRRALLAAAKRGVRVTLLLEGKIQYRLQYYATQALYGQMLAAGIRVCEYRQGYLHAKVAVIDAQWSTVGSSNIDPFSLLLAREANIAIRNAAFAAELRQALQPALVEGSLCIGPTDHLTWLQRARAWICYAIVRTLIGLAGYSKLH